MQWAKPEAERAQRVADQPKHMVGRPSIELVPGKTWWGRRVGADEVFATFVVAGCMEFLDWPTTCWPPGRPLGLLGTHFSQGTALLPL
jgi:hypothetical protein